MSAGIVMEAIRRVTIWGLTEGTHLRRHDSRLQHV
jgi:hypothetical protein